MKILLTGVGKEWHVNILYKHVKDIKGLHVDFKQLGSILADRSILLEYDVLWSLGFFSDAPLIYALAKSYNPELKIVNEWVGTDIIMYNNAISMYPYLKNVLLKHVDAHVTTYDILQDELLQLGIQSHIVEAIPEKMYNIMPLPKGLDYATYIPPHRKDFYMYPVIVKLAEEYPDVNFHIFSLQDWKDYKPEFPNIHIHNKVTGKEKDKWVADTRAFISLVKHGGVGVMVQEWKHAGRYVIANRKLKYCHSVMTIDDIRKAIEDINSKTEPDREGSKYYHERYNPNIVRKHFKHVIEEVMSNGEGTESL